MKPIATPAHEAKESKTIERKEHQTGKELSKPKPYGRPMGKR